MNNEHVNREIEPTPKRADDYSPADNLKFMRSVMEKIHRKIDPGWPIMIAWGLIFMIGFPAATLVKVRQLDNWKWPLYLVLVAVGSSMAIYFVAKATLRERNAGVISQLSTQIYGIWCILTANGIIWTYLGLFRDHIGGFGFLWAAVYGIALSMMGILYSKEWLLGGIAIFFAILAAFFVKSYYAYVILGIATGLAGIIPAIIAQRNYRKQEKSYE